MSNFPPIAEYGLLSNCEQSCLVAPDGSVEWLCLPRPDSPSVFGALLDRAAGLFRFGPSNAQVPQHRRYVPGTMVLEATWQTPTGWMIVQDFLAVGPVQDQERRPDYRRAPTDTGAIGALVRVATCISGHAEVMVNCGPLFNYGTAGATWSYRGEGYDAMTAAPAEGDVRLELAGSIQLGVLGARAYGRTTLTQGQSAFVVLSWGDAKVPASQAEAAAALDITVDFWRDWLSAATIPDHLSGYEGARPVRVGNGAWNQKQHDVWGMILDALDVQFHQAAEQIVAPVWEGLAGFADAALEHWREPDQGIWEVRGEPKHFTASKVMCWVAAARGADLADERGDEERAKRWRAGAEKIKADVLAKDVSKRGVFRQHDKTDDLDASLLLLPIMGFLPPDDERIKATVLAIADELTEDGLVLRYKVEGTDTGFSGKEGTFTICSFWLVSALAMIGETERAHALCQKLLSFAGPLQLYAEEIDATTGQHLGNFPQAFTHLALIDAVSSLIEMESKEGSAPATA